MTTLKQHIQFNPARTFASVGVLFQALSTFLALNFGWSAEKVLAFDGLTTALVAVIGTFFMAASTVSTTALDAYQKALQDIQGGDVNAALKDVADAAAVIQPQVQVLVDAAHEAAKDAKDLTDLVKNK